ncbi:hypothetical protein HDV06_000811 [Boothiomyces sp. JEL0866]|nr:hypothetical protein HDV06_000811 [Boothiomyces sp. JEL0866]
MEADSTVDSFISSLSKDVISRLKLRHYNCEHPVSVARSCEALDGQREFIPSLLNIDLEARSLSVTGFSVEELNGTNYRYYRWKVYPRFVLSRMGKISQFSRLLNKLKSVDLSVTAGEFFVVMQNRNNDNYNKSFSSRLQRGNYAESTITMCFKHTMRAQAEFADVIKDFKELKSRFQDEDNTAFMTELLNRAEKCTKSYERSMSILEAIINTVTSDTSDIAEESGNVPPIAKFTKETRGEKNLRINALKPPRLNPGLVAALKNIPVESVTKDSSNKIQSVVEKARTARVPTDYYTQSSDYSSYYDYSDDEEALPEISFGLKKSNVKAADFVKVFKQSVTKSDNALRATTGSSLVEAKKSSGKMQPAHKILPIKAPTTVVITPALPETAKTIKVVKVEDRQPQPVSDKPIIVTRSKNLPLANSTVSRVQVKQPEVVRHKRSESLSSVTSVTSIRSTASQLGNKKPLVVKTRAVN